MAQVLMASQDMACGYENNTISLTIMLKGPNEKPVPHTEAYCIIYSAIKSSCNDSP